MNNEQIIESTGIKPGDFIVLMVTSAAAAKKVTPPPAATAPVVTNTTAKPSAESTETPSNVESTLVTGAAYEEAVSRITEMGFSRESAVKALRASFNNPDRAVEYLTSGFPLDNLGDEAVEGGVAVAVEDGDEDDGLELANDEDDEGEDEDGEGATASALEFLRQDPQFQQIRAVIQQNPQLLGPIIEQLGQHSPEIFQLIQQHEEEFLALMNQDPDGEELDFEGAFATGAEGAAPNTRIIELTEAEAAAVERLQALGFDKARVIEAYFACDKNEELAANLLFESMGDDDF